MPNCIKNNVPTDKLPAELNRRRIVIIDMLVYELLLRDHEVTHNPSKTLRKARVPEDWLCEKLTIDGVDIEVALRQARAGDNRLKARLTWEWPDELNRWQKHAVTTVSEPKAGWNSVQFADLVIEELDAAKRAAGEAALNAELGAQCKAIKQAYSDIDFRLAANAAHGGRDRFGPFHLEIFGLCPHLVVRVLDLLRAANEADNCGAKELDPDTRSTLN